MRKVFLEDLPKHLGGKGSGAGAKKGNINWKASIGYKVKFIYDDIEGDFKIINILKIENRSNYILTIEYKKKTFDIDNGSFRDAYLGNILNPEYREYKFRVGEIVSKNKQKIEIINTIRFSRKGKKKDIVRGYEYKCLIDGNVSEIDEISLLRNKNICSVCANDKVLKGVNDLNTTHSALSKLFKNKEDTYRYSYGSNKKVMIKCLDCGLEKEIMIRTLVSYGFSCPKCGDGISYPEKIMFNVLEQLNVKNRIEELFHWSKNIMHNNPKLSGNKKYDFYISTLNCIIEMHGGQHYLENGFISLGGRNLNEEQENDKLKYNLAIQNGIKEDDYIIIDCRKSDLEFIKDKIINSRLSNMFDLSNIDWFQAEKFALNSRVREACDLWNNGLESTNKISQIMELKQQTIIKYLHKGVNLKWCTYNPEEVMKRNGKSLSKKYSNNCIGKVSGKRKQIICLNDMKVFSFFEEANEYYNINLVSSNISKCCHGIRKHSGILKDGTKLQWMYYEDYLKL